MISNHSIWISLSFSFLIIQFLSPYPLPVQLYFLTYSFGVRLFNLFLIILFMSDYPISFSLSISSTIILFSIIDFLPHHPFHVWLSFSYSIMDIWFIILVRISNFFLLIHFLSNYTSWLIHLVSDYSNCFSLSFLCLIIQFLSHYAFPVQLSFFNYWFPAPSSFSRLFILFVQQG